MANATLSTYPTTVDTFNRISDLDKDSTMIKARQYKSYINAGNYTGAENYLKNNPDLKQCAISAEIVNKHSDAIVAIENDINNNVKSDISDVNNEIINVKNDIKSLDSSVTSLINKQTTIDNNINDINTNISRLKNPWTMFVLADSFDASNNYFLNCSSKKMYGGVGGGFTAQNSYITCPYKGKIVLNLNVLMGCTITNNIEYNGYTGIFIFNHTKNKYCDYSVGGLGNIPCSTNSIDRSTYVSAKSCPFEVDGGDIIQIVLKNPSEKVKINPFGDTTVSGISYGSGNTLTLEYIDFEYN